MENNHIDIDSDQYAREGITGGEDKVIDNPGIADPTKALPKKYIATELTQKLTYKPKKENRL